MVKGTFGSSMPAITFAEQRTASGSMIFPYTAASGKKWMPNDKKAASQIIQ